MVRGFAYTLQILVQKWPCSLESLQVCEGNFFERLLTRFSVPEDSGRALAVSLRSRSDSQIGGNFVRLILRGRSVS